MSVFTRRFKIPRELRRPIGIILDEITRPPQKRNKTDIYARGVSDGVNLVRQRALERGIRLEQPFIEEPVSVTFIEVNVNGKEAEAKKY